jgi:hypothetical protein
LELHKFIAIGQGILPYSSLEGNKQIHTQNKVISCAASALHICTELTSVMYVYITVTKTTQALHICTELTNVMYVYITVIKTTQTITLTSVIMSA